MDPYDYPTSVNPARLTAPPNPRRHSHSSLKNAPQSTNPVEDMANYTIDRSVEFLLEDGQADEAAFRGALGVDSTIRVHSEHILGKAATALELKSQELADGALCASPPLRRLHKWEVSCNTYYRLLWFPTYLLPVGCSGGKP